MQIVIVLAVLLVSYLLGSIPFGWVMVKIITGRDIRGIESGRTGGTNAWRAAGGIAGAMTAILDGVKAAAAVWLVRWLVPADLPYFHWVEVAAPLLAILGHNYSIYMLERHETTGKVRLRGGAGGAPCMGGAAGLWMPALIYILPLAMIVYFVVGYASLTTLSIAFFSTILFAILASMDLLPWQYIIYGLVSLGLLAWALRPNLKRLAEGTERLHGLRVWLKK
jgi:acyl phosphate:glycerol-3-phosphate acyltransferase